MQNGLFFTELTPFVAVIALPVLAPLAALLQLLFPGLLKDQWQQYRVAGTVLMSQSTILVLQWALVTWFFTDGAWWLQDATVAAGVAILAGVGVVVAVALSRWPDEWGDLPEYGEPTLFEGVALGVFVVIGTFWILYQAVNRQPIFDQMTVATAGCAAGMAHLAVRRFWPRWCVTKVTEVVMLVVMACVGAMLAAHMWLAGTLPDYRGGSNEQFALKTDWPTHRRDNARSGGDGNASLAVTLRAPEVLWTFQPKLGSMEVEFHASPAVVDDYLFIGARATLITESRGYLFCLRCKDGVIEPKKSNASGGPEPILKRPTAGDDAWRIGGQGYKPIFTSPIISGGKVYFGEGYHQHRNCRLMVVDPAKPGELHRVYKTTSHTESSPTMVGTRAIFGAGDDGLLCVDFAVDPPKKLWQVERVHVDGSPLVVGNQAYVGAVVGDIHADLVVLGVDVDQGTVTWRYPTDLPPAGSPAFAGNNIVIGLGNGKFGQDAAEPAGAMLAIDRVKGTKAWRYDTPAGVLNAAAVAGERVVFTCRDRHVYCLGAAKGDLLWKRELSTAISAAPAIVGDCVIAVAGDGMVYCLKLDDGSVVWQFAGIRAPEYEAIASPVAVDGRIYVAIGNKVHCLGRREVP